MIDVYIGKLGIPDSTLQLEFDTFADASDFCDLLKDHYKEEATMLYMAIDSTREFESLEEVFKDEKMEGEIDEDAFDEILAMQAQKDD